MHDDEVPDPRSGFAATLAESGLPVLARAVAAGVVDGPGLHAVLEALAGLAGEGYGDADLATAEEFLTTIAAGTDAAEVGDVVREHCEQILRPELEQDEADGWDELADLSEDLGWADAENDLPVVGLYTEDLPAPSASMSENAPARGVSVATTGRVLDQHAGRPSQAEGPHRVRRRSSSRHTPARPGSPARSRWTCTAATSGRPLRRPRFAPAGPPAARSRRTAAGRAPPTAPLPPPGGPAPPPAGRRTVVARSTPSTTVGAEGHRPDGAGFRASATGSRASTNCGPARARAVALIDPPVDAIGHGGRSGGATLRA